MEKILNDENFLKIYFKASKHLNEMWSEKSISVALDRLNSLGNQSAKNLSDKILWFMLELRKVFEKMSKIPIK